MDAFAKRRQELLGSSSDDPFERRRKMLSSMDSEQREMGQKTSEQVEANKQDVKAELQKLPIAKIENTPLYQNAQKPLPTTTYDPELPGRDLPVVGPVLRALDKLEANPIRKKAGEIALELYTPGAGLSAISATTNAVEGAVGRLLPKLANPTGLAGKAAKTAITEGVTGVPLGIGQSLASGETDIGQATKEGVLYGGGLGAGVGAAGPVIGRGIQKFAGTAVGESLTNLFKRKQSMTPEIEQVVTDALKVETPAPQKTVTINGKLRPASQESYINNVMTQIKPEVTMRMTPPLENPNELAKWLQPHLGDSSLNEIRNMGYDYLVELATEVRGQLSTYDIARQVAKERGFNLDNILEGKLPSINERVKMDASKRAYGIYDAPQVNLVRPVSDPNFQAPVRPEVKTTPIRSAELNIKRPIEQPIVESVEGPAMPSQPAQAVQRTSGERGFINTLQESDKAPQGFKERLSAKYTPITNERTVELANRRLDKDIEAAAGYVMGNSRFSAEKVTTAHRLIDEFNKAGNYERAVQIAEKIAEEGTKAGQTVQAFSIYNRLTPEGVLVHAQRVAQKTNEMLPVGVKEVKVTADMAAQLTDLAATTQKMTGVRDLANDVTNILEQAKSGKTLTEEQTAQIRKFIEESRQFVKEVAEKPKAPKAPKMPQDKKIKDNVISFLDAQERAAKERLRAKGIRISSTPIDIWADYAIIGAAKMGKGTIKFADWSTEMLKELGDDIRPHLENLYEKARETFEMSAKKVSHSAYNRADKIVQRVLKDKQITEEQAIAIQALTDKVLNLSGDAKRLASQDLQAILSTLEKPGVLKRVSSIQTMAQLMNPKTLLVRNPIGNELFYRVERMNKLVAAPIDWGRVKLFGGQRAVTFRTNNQGEYWKNWLTGLRAGWKGVNPEGLQTQFDIGPAAFNGKWNPLTYMERALGASLKSFDFAAYKRAVNNTIGEMATLRAMNEGLTGAEQKAAIQKYIREADDHVLSIADQYGKYVTFQDNNAISKGLTGLKRGLNLGKDFGFGDLIIKYPKTPGALLMRALEYSPAGFLRSATIAAKPLWRKGSDPNTPEAMMALTRAITGTFGLSGLGWFMLDKNIITGSASKDRDIRDLEKSAGKGQYQVNTSALVRWVKSGFDPKAAEMKVGDTLYTYDWMQPVSIAVSMGANASKSSNEGESTGNALIDLGKTAYNSVEGGVNSLVEQSVLSGVKRAVEGYPGQTVMDKVVDILSEVPASFVPSSVNQAKQLTDNARRETYAPDKLEQSLNKAKARVPGLAGSLPQQYDTLGKPKETYQNNSAFNVLLNPGFTSKYELSPEAQLIVDLIEETGDESLAPRVPSKSLSYKDENNQSMTRKLTTEEYSRIQQLQGEQTQKLLSRISPTSSVNSQVKRVKDSLDTAGEKARTQLKKEIGVK